MELKFNSLDTEGAFGSNDYEYIQEYIEESSRRMNERKFVEKYRPKGMGERLHLETTADVFEIEERKWLESGKESGDYD